MWGLQDGAAVGLGFLEPRELSFASKIAVICKKTVRRVKKKVLEGEGIGREGLGDRGMYHESPFTLRVPPYLESIFTLRVHPYLEGPHPYLESPTTLSVHKK